MVTDTHHSLAQTLVETLAARGLKITTAESCTGGLVAAAITSVSGSSAVFDRGIVSYANSAKCELLGVDAEMLRKYGAVSAEVAQAMATGARRNAHADMAIAVTGIAGPTGGSPEKPVGLVYIGVSAAVETRVQRFDFSGTREEIRALAAREALAMALSLLGNIPK